MYEKIEKELYILYQIKMNPKEKLIELIAKDKRIRDYNAKPTHENLKKAVIAYEEIVKEFCKEYDQSEKTILSIN